MAKLANISLWLFLQRYFWEQEPLPFHCCAIKRSSPLTLPFFFGPSGAKLQNAASDFLNWI